MKNGKFQGGIGHKLGKQSKNVIYTGFFLIPHKTPCKSLLAVLSCAGMVYQGSPLNRSSGHPERITTTEMLHPLALAQRF